MKKIISILLITLSFQAWSQKNAAKIPANVLDAFGKMYPHVKAAEWKAEEGNYEAEFKAPNMNKKEGGKAEVMRTVVMNAQGTLVQEEEEMEITDLPAVITDYVKNELAGKKITEASRITLNTGDMNYEVELGKTDYLFNADGKFLSKEEDKIDDDKKKK